MLFQNLLICLFWGKEIVFVQRGRGKGRKYKPGFCFSPCNFSPCRNPRFILFLWLLSLFLKWQFYRDGRTLISRFLKTRWLNYDDDLKLILLHMIVSIAENSGFLDKSCMSEGRKSDFPGI